MGRTLLDHLERRVTTSIKQLWHEMESVGDFEERLPFDEISIKQTADGVNVKFIQKAKVASRPIKDVDES